MPDARNLVDRIYRYRYVLDKDAFPVPREPITGFVIEPRSSETNSPAYSKTYYIYAVETYQEFERGVQDGVYYLTLLLADVQVDHDRMVRGDGGSISQNLSLIHI